MNSTVKQSSPTWKLVPPDPKEQMDDLIPALCESIRQVICRFADREERRNIFALLLPNVDGPTCEFAHRLCEWLPAEEPMWLALRFDSQGRPGLCGIVATRESVASIRRMVFGVTLGSVEIKVIAKKEECWRPDADDLQYRRLCKVINRALQPSPHVNLPGHYRVVANGRFKVAWMKSTGLSIADRRTMFVSAPQTHVIRERTITSRPLSGEQFAVQRRKAAWARYRQKLDARHWK